jgi:hypothetical protein
MTTVTFKNPFVLSCFDETLPAGTYDIEIDEQLVDGLSFPVYRRIAALLHLHVAPDRPKERQILTVDLNELDAVLERDGAGAGEVGARARDAETAEPSDKRGGPDQGPDDHAATVRW